MKNLVMVDKIKLNFKNYFLQLIKDYKRKVINTKTIKVLNYNQISFLLNKLNQKMD